MALLGEYLNTYQRANPAEGLLKGFQTGSQFMFAAQQQKMQQEQLAQQKTQQEKQDDLRQLTVLLEAYGKIKSKTGKTQIGQRFAELYSKLNPESPMSGSDFVHTETADNFMTKARGLKKLLTENPELGIKEIDNLLVEAAQEESEGNIERQEYQDLEKSVAGVKKEAAGELGGLATYPEQFRSDPAYQTPEAKAGVEGYQQQKISQMTALGEGTQANQIVDNLQKANENKEQSYKYTLANEEQDAEGSWWRKNPKSGEWEVQKAGSDKYVRSSQGPADILKDRGKLRDLPGEAVDGLSMIMTVKDTLNDIKGRLSSQAAKSGVVKGRIAALNNALRGDKDWQQVAGDMELLITVVYALSGKQVADKEIERYNKSILPKMKDPSVSAEAKLETLDRYITNLYNNKLKNYKRARYYIDKEWQEMKPGTYTFTPDKTGAKPKTWEDLKKAKGL